MKSILVNFYRHLAIFSGHTASVVVGQYYLFTLFSKLPLQSCDNVRRLSMLELIVPKMLTLTYVGISSRKFLLIN